LNNKSQMIFFKDFILDKCFCSHSMQLTKSWTYSSLEYSRNIVIYLIGVFTLSFFFLNMFIFGHETKVNHLIFIITAVACATIALCSFHCFLELFLALYVRFSASIVRLDNPSPHALTIHSQNKDSY